MTPRALSRLLPLLALAAPSCYVDEVWKGDLVVVNPFAGADGAVVHRWSDEVGCGSPDEWYQQAIQSFRGEGEHVLSLTIDSPSVLASLYAIVWDDVDHDDIADCDEPGLSLPVYWADGFGRVEFSPDTTMTMGGATPGCYVPQGGDDDTYADDDAWQDDDNGQDDDSAPVVEVVDRHPAPGATDAWYRTDVWVRLSAPADVESFRLVDGQANEIPVALFASADGTEMTFDPYGASAEEHLQPDTRYVVSFAYDGGQSSWEFTTSSLGTPVDDVSAAIGAVYGIDWATFEVAEPPGIGPIITVLPPEQVYTLLVPTSLDAAAGTSRVVLGAVAEPEEGVVVQDRCAATSAIEGPPPIGFIDPRFETEAKQASLPLGGETLTFTDATLGGDLLGDSSGVEEVVASGWTDTRELIPLIDPDDPSAICELVASFGAECEPCPQDGEPYCLTIRLEHGRAARLDGVAFEEVDAETAAANAETGTCY